MEKPSSTSLQDHYGGSPMSIVTTGHISEHSREGRGARVGGLLASHYRFHNEKSRPEPGSKGLKSR